jgi:hypothetical protein
MVSEPSATNLWRAGLRNRARHPNPSLCLPKLVGHQTLLARYLSEEPPGALAQRGGRRLAGCSSSAPCASAACPICRALGDAWQLGTQPRGRPRYRRYVHRRIYESSLARRSIRTGQP